MSGWPRSIAASMTWRPACASGAATSGRASAGTSTRFGRSGRTLRRLLAALPTRSASGSRVCGRGCTWPSGERLQATAAAKTGSARDRAKTGIRELRGHRLAVTERLDDLRDAPTETWMEHQERVTAARDELERMADDLSASLF